MKERISWMLFTGYCLLILWLTIFSREPAHYRTVKFELFWSYRAWFAGESYGKKESLQNISNVLLFIPFGLLFPIKSAKSWFIVSAGALLSLAIETVQYVLVLGWCEVDDVICNTLGVALGVGFSKIINKIIGES